MYFIWTTSIPPTNYSFLNVHANWHAQCIIRCDVLMYVFQQAVQNVMIISCNLCNINILSNVLCSLFSCMTWENNV